LKAGEATAYAVRVRIDVYDESSVSWPATPDPTAYPRDTDAFQRRHGYDAVFRIRTLAPGAACTGATSGGAGGP
jgi:hypothetical protein